MLEKANERNCYKLLKKADLLQDLPLTKSSFDYLLCVGTTTYLEPNCLKFWLGAVKSKGYILLTHKTTVWPKWEPIQAKFQDDQIWKHIWTSKDLFYLPSCSGEDIITRVRIYIYQKQ